MHFGCREQYGVTSVERGTQAYQADLTSIVAALLFPAFNHLAGSFAPLKFGSPNAEESTVWRCADLCLKDYSLERWQL